MVGAERRPFKIGYSKKPPAAQELVQRAVVYAGMQGRLPEPVALLEHDVGDGDDDHHHAAGDEEGPVDVAELQVLVGQQVAAGSVGGDHAVLVAVQVLPLVADGVVQVQAGVIAHVQLQLHCAGKGAAVVQLKLQPLFALGKGDGSVDLAGGALYAFAGNVQGVAVAHHAQGLAGGAQGVQNLAGHDGHLRLVEYHLILAAVLNGLHHRVQRDGGAVVRGIGAVIAAVAAGGSLCRAVHDDRDHGSGFAVGDGNGGRTGAYRRNHARRADRGNAAVAGLEGKGLGCAGRGGLGRDGAGGTGLEHDVVGAGGDHLPAVAGGGASAAGGIRGQGKHRYGGGGYHRAAGSGNGGFAGSYAGHAAKAVDRGDLLVRGGQGDGGVVGSRAGAHLQRSRHRVAHIDGVGGKSKIHLGNDHGRIHGNHDGVGADLVAGCCGNGGSANAHSLYHAAAAYGQHAAVVGQKDHRVGAVTGLDHGGQLLGSAQQHIGRVAAGGNALGRDVLGPGQ